MAGNNSSDWQDLFFSKKWNSAFWERNLNYTVLSFTGHSSTLIVGFDKENQAANKRSWAPWGSQFALENDHSFLGYSADLPDWYLGDYVMADILKRVESNWFSKFDNVIFSGFSMGGYAALRLSSLVPNSKVVAFSPQTTMAPDLVDFDRRFPEANRLDWKVQNPDCAFMRFEKSKCFVVYDPCSPEDSGHASRLRDEDVTKLRAWHSGGNSFLYLNRMGVIAEIFALVIEGKLTLEKYYELYRHRKHMRWYRNTIEQHLEKRGATEAIEKFRDAHKKLLAQAIEIRNIPTAKNCL